MASITVELLGTREALRPLIERYGVYARRVHFPRHARPQGGSYLAAGAYYYALMMSFDRQGLARAAALALTEPPRLVLDSQSHSKESMPAIDANRSAAMTPR